MIRCKSYSLLLFLVICVVPACVPMVPSADAGMKRHMVIYGGLRDADLPAVAEQADILVLDYIRPRLLKRLKSLNPDIILLKYQHGIGYYPSYPAWHEVDRHEDWFLHAGESGERLVERNYGWYLMDITADSWKRFWTDAVVGGTYPIYDGVFIDDCWNRFVPKFRGHKSQSPARPPDDIVIEWSRHLKSLLVHLKTHYGGLVYINGAHREYLPVVDGCMDEGFIHASWVSDRKMPDADTVARTLIRIESLQAMGKPLLLQSGTAGDDPSRTQSVYEYCRTAFLLAANDHTYFGFHPYATYAFKGLLPYRKVEDPGHPLEPMQMTEWVDLTPNLVPNADFKTGLSPWRVLSGNPRLITARQPPRQAVQFESRMDNPDRIISPFIPVKANVDYRLSARCKADLNRSVSAEYRKLGLQGRFFDRDRRQLPGAYDIKFDEGSYDWLSFGRTLTSPAKAAYFQIRIGFIGDGIGSGQVDKVRFARLQPEAFVIQRRFSKAVVALNAGSRETILTLDDSQNSGRDVPLPPGQAKIIQLQAP